MVTPREPGHENKKKGDQKKRGMSKERGIGPEAKKKLTRRRRSKGERTGCPELREELKLDRVVLYMSRQQPS
jgi:hypothetical protein